MRPFDNPVVGYLGAVLGVIAIASIAVFDLRGTTAKAQRHWDADIDRIISQRQEKKRDLDTAMLAWSEIPDAESEAGPQLSALPGGTAEDEAASDGIDSQRTYTSGGKKYNSNRPERRRHYIATSLVALPKIAATAAATTTTTLLRLR